MIRRILIAFIFYFILFNNSWCSAWTKKKNELGGILEVETNSNYFKTIFKDSSSLDYYQSISYKLYLEYGLVDKLTIGGYIKNYNFYSQFLKEDEKNEKKVNNDYYGNIFLNQNFYNKNNKTFSLQYGFYFPIKYTRISKNVNTIDTKYAFELISAFGNSGNLNLLDTMVSYYFDISAAYKLVNDIDYDQVTLGTTFGFRLNESSTLNFHYEYQFYLKENLGNKKTIYNYYNGNNSNQIKIIFDYKFLNNLSTEFSFHKTYSSQDSIGVKFAFLFSY